MPNLAFPSPAPRANGRRAIVTAVLAALLLGAIAAVAHAIPPGGPVDDSNGARVTIDRRTVEAGGRIRVTGRKWRSKGSRTGGGAVVTIKLDDRDVLQVLEINNRRFAGWVRIPRQVRAGRHWLRFLAASPATSIKSRRFRVTR